MPMPLDTREIEVVNAIADVILSTTDILPSTTLSAPASAAGDSLTVSPVTNFLKRGYVHFFDNTGENMAAIKSIDPDTGVVTLDYTGYTEYGFPANLQYAHESGALIATNLMLHRPQGIEPMLRSGLPVVAMWPVKKDPQEWTFGSSMSICTIHIQIHVSLQQWESSPMDVEVYTQMQQRRCQDAMQQILNALDNNRHLAGRYNAPGAHVQGLGDGKSPTFARVVWEPVVDTLEIPQTIGAMDVTVRPRQHVRNRPS